MAVDQIVNALRRPAGHEHLTVIPELMLWKAICTGCDTDFQLCVNTHQQVFKDYLGALAVVAGAKRICASRSAFIKEGLELPPAAVERLWLHLDALGSLDSRTSEPLDSEALTD